MKKAIIFSVLCLFSFILDISAQIEDGWTEAGNAAYNSNFKSIEFTSNMNGYAVGSGGSYLRTTDGGLTWTAHNTGFNFGFNKIDFVDEMTGYIIGNVEQYYKGRLLKTTDGGSTWTLIYSINEGFNTMNFDNSGTGYLAGYEKFYKSSDGGMTWNSATITNAYDIFGVFFKNANDGYIAANGGAWKTSDGGQNWVKFQNGTYNDIIFIDNNTGYMSSNYTQDLLKTTDGGANWNSTTSTGISISNHLFFKDSQNGFAWSDSDTAPGKIAKTSNGGSSWTLITIPSKLTMREMCFQPNGNFFLCGGGGNILKSTNGSTWTIASEGLFKGMLNDMCFASNNTIFACGENGTIVKSTDNASSWTKLNSGTTEKLWGICSTPSNTLFALGNNKTILKSINNGTTWTNSNTGFDETEANQAEIKFLDDNVGFIALNDIFKTIDGGKTWKKVLDTLTSWSIDIIDANTIYAAGLWGVFKSIDGGNTWKNINKQNKIFWGVDFLDANYGIAAYQDFYPHTTKDGGATWTKKKLNSFELRDAAIINPNTMYVVGKNGAIAKTIDGAENWSTVNSNTTRHLFDIFFGSDGTGYILGEDGMILRKPFVQTYDLTFDVKNKNGTPVNDAILTLNGFSYPAGTYVVKGLIPGNYEYKISGDGYCDVEGFIVLISNHTENVILDNCYNLIFTVTNIFSSPIEGALIELGDSKVTTNNSGIASMNFKAGNDIDYKISAVGFKTLSGKTNITRDSNFIFKMETDLNAPVALEATDVSHNGFKANWKIPQNAEKVMLYISEDNFANHIIGYNGLETKDTTHEVKGLKSETKYSYRLKAVNKDGESEYSNIINVSTIINGTSEYESDINFLMFPNPVSNILNIEINKPVKSEIIIEDINGKTLISKHIEYKSSCNFNMSRYNAGIYTCRLIVENKVYSYKFVKI